MLVDLFILSIKKAIIHGKSFAIGLKIMKTSRMYVYVVYNIKLCFTEAAYY